VEALVRCLRRRVRGADVVLRPRGGDFGTPPPPLFENGSSAGIPTRDGFYLYRPPYESLIRSPPRALVILDHGKEVARFRLANPYRQMPLIGGVTHRPGGADVARARRVIVARTAVGPAAIMVAPSNLAPATLLVAPDPPGRVRRRLRAER
jgi:hypothetical protein